jgi:hypothetical protein
VAIPAFVIFRDRRSYAGYCLDALLAAGLDPVVVDHGSTWRPADEWLHHLEACHVRVIPRGPGHHPRSLWEDDEFLELCGTGRYVVTDCDVVPADGCPPDWPEHLDKILDGYPGFSKIGLGLRTGNIPAHYARRDHVIAWEQQYWQHEIEPGVYSAPVDTTLALYQPLGDWPRFTLSGLRTGPPYVADHLAWHENLDDLSPELAWYHEHAEPGISYWTVPGRSAWGS